MVHLGIRLSRRTMTTLGRETFLMPVLWKQGWPWISETKRSLLEADGPVFREQKEPSQWQADFTKKEWDPRFVWLRSKKELNAEQRNGSMILYPAKRKTGQVSGFMGVCPMDFACEVGMMFSFDPKTAGEEAGLMIYLSSEFHYRIGKQKRSDGVYLIMERTAEDLVQPVMERRIGPVSNRFISCEVSGRCFTGTLIGIYAWSAEDTDAKVIVSEFYQKKIET